MAAPKKVEESNWTHERRWSLEVGQICNIVVNGQLLPNYEFLGQDNIFMHFRGDLRVSPQCEAVLIPIHAVERLGLCGVR